MKGRGKMRTGIIAVVVLMSLACAAGAADTSKITLSLRDTPIDQALAEISKQSGIPIVCDTGVTANLSGHFEAIETEKLLDAITKPNNLKWQKLYLPTVEGETKPTLEQIKARAEAVAAVTGGPIIVVDPATGREKVFVEQDATAPSVAPDKLGLKPVYVVMKPKAQTTTAQTATDSQDVPKQFQTLQDQRIKLLAQMTPEQRKAAFQQEMTYMLSLDPGVRQQVMMDQMQARFSMDPQTQDAYRQAMRDTWQAMRDQGLIPERGDRGFGGDGGNRRPRGDGTGGGRRDRGNGGAGPN